MGNLSEWAVVRWCGGRVLGGCGEGWQVFRGGVLEEVLICAETGSDLGEAVARKNLWLG